MVNSSDPIFFDITKAFELRDTIEKSKLNNSNEINNIHQNQSDHTEQLNDVIRSLPLMNDNIRLNIKLGIEIYKQLNNFDRNNIHSKINENSIKSN